MGSEITELVGKNKPNDAGLTVQQERFAREYVADRDPIKAYAAAGYASKDASTDRKKANDILALPIMQRRIAQLENSGNIAETISREEYHNKILATYEAAMADGDYAAANKAMELIGKAMNFLIEEKRTLNINATVPSDKAAKVESIKRLGKLAGVTIDLQDETPAR